MGNRPISELKRMTKEERHAEDIVKEEGEHFGKSEERVEVYTLLPKSTKKSTYADVVKSTYADVVRKNIVRTENVLRGNNLTTEILTKNRSVCKEIEIAHNLG